MSFNGGKAFDRQAAISSYEELSRLDPNRLYNLLLCDGALEDLLSLEQKIVDLIYPRVSHMDFNIGIVLYLASRGIGYLYSNGKITTNVFKSSARIVFDGLGADEIFGGYSRYKLAAKRGKQEQRLEMLFDLSRLWVRNLGRDDRIISTNGKEARFPFLASSIIDLSLKTDLDLLTDFKLPKGVGDKIIIRKVAKNLGLDSAENLQKKAVQFGTGIAKMTNIQKYGSHKKAKGSSSFKKTI